MKVVILAGGYGTRLSEETDLKPKPMVEIGGKPILWHIMKTYSEYGFNEFIILLGYKGYVIKEYFSNYFLHQSNVTINLADNSIDVHQNKSEAWKVTLLDTGLNTMTGGRIKQISPFIGDEDFLLTYGDGLSDVNILELVDFHKQHGKDITMTAVQPDGRYGSINIESDNSVSNFLEKPLGDGSWINGGFFVCSPKILDTISSNSTIFEQEPLVNLAKNNQLMSFKHEGFWKAMDTLKDKKILNEAWNDGNALWKVWSE
jgi:glucose-1-phosphate cytidylyltransferase